MNKYLGNGFSKDEDIFTNGNCLINACKADFSSGCSGNFCWNNSYSGCNWFFCNGKGKE
ncbi:MAG: hypothetical protein IKR39_08115 [Lachnospiraceae bacterium]|nr:hypothetical protein [Lachnospiraceae bacterium]